MTSPKIFEIPDSRTTHTVDRSAVNTIMRLGLLLVIIISVLLTILAARPPLRYFGDYPATIGTPGALDGERGAVVAYITVSDPAVVTFPPSWQRPDAVCFTLQVARTKTPIQPAFNDYVPQIRWNDPYNDILSLDAKSFQAHAANGETMRLTNSSLAGLISEHTAYQVQWFGEDTIAIAPDHTAGGLLCANFSFDGGKTNVPPFFSLTIGVHNGYVARQPAYYFSYHDLVQANQHPVSTVELTATAVTDYLAGLAADSPFAALQQNVR